MDSSGLDQVNKSLRRVADALEAMRAANDLGTFEDRWSDLLNYASQTLNQVIASTKDGATKGWSDSIVHALRIDDLLQYARQARDTEFHGIKPITATKRGVMNIRATDQPVRIKQLKIVPRGSQLEVQAEHDGGLLMIEFVPDSVELAAVVNRGQTYEPPSEHLGQPIVRATPVLVGEFLYEYLQRTVREAAVRLGLI